VTGGRAPVWPPFVWASLGLAITAGFGLGAALFAAQALQAPIGLWWPAAAQAHGHTQLFGWIGLMVLGVGFHVLPRLRGAPVLATPLIRATNEIFRRTVERGRYGIGCQGPHRAGEAACRAQPDQGACPLHPVSAAAANFHDRACGQRSRPEIGHPRRLFARRHAPLTLLAGVAVDREGRRRALSGPPPTPGALISGRPRNAPPSSASPPRGAGRRTP